MLKHLFDIYLRLLPVFSINRGDRGGGGEGGGGGGGGVPKILLSNKGRGHMTREQGGPNFRGGRAQRYAMFE